MNSTAPGPLCRKEDLASHPLGTRFVPLREDGIYVEEDVIVSVRNHNQVLFRSAASPHSPGYGANASTYFLAPTKLPLMHETPRGACLADDSVDAALAALDEVHRLFQDMCAARHQALLRLGHRLAPALWWWTNGEGLHGSLPPGTGGPAISVCLQAWHIRAPNPFTGVSARSKHDGPGTEFIKGSDAEALLRQIALAPPHPDCKHPDYVNKLLGVLAKDLGLERTHAA